VEETCAAGPAQEHNRRLLSAVANLQHTSLGILLRFNLKELSGLAGEIGASVSRASGGITLPGRVFFGAFHQAAAWAGVALDGVDRQT
jgi:hypothetical protein